MDRTYKPAKGAGYGVKQAQVLGGVLEKLGEHVTPEQVVNAARSEDSPIHAMFEWDDTAAAEQFRLHQARQHVAHLEIVITTPEGDIETRAYHSVVIVSGDDKQRGYAHMSDIRRSPALYEQVIASALRELKSWQSRYEEYRDVFGRVFEAIEQANRKSAKKPRKRKVA